MSENRHNTGFRGPDPSVGKATQFKPGKSGNAGGRPRKKPLSESFQILGRSPMPPGMCRSLGVPAGTTWAMGAALGIARAAIEGNVAAAKEFREAIEGKIHERVDLTVNAGEDIVLRLKRAHKRMQKLKAQREAAKLTNGAHTIDVAAITSGT